MQPLEDIAYELCRGTRFYLMRFDRGTTLAFYIDRKNSQMLVFEFLRFHSSKQVRDNITKQLTQSYEDSLNSRAEVHVFDQDRRLPVRGSLTPARLERPPMAAAANREAQASLDWEIMVDSSLRKKAQR